MINIIGEACLAILMLCGVVVVVGLTVILIRLLWTLSMED